MEFITQITPIINILLILLFAYMAICRICEAIEYKKGRDIAKEELDALNKYETIKMIPPGDE